MRHLRWIAIAAAFALVGVFLAFALEQGADNAASIGAERERRERVEKQLAEQEAAAAVLAEQLRVLGQKPAVEPENPPAPGQVIPLPGPKGDRGESCIEEIGYPRCRGDEGQSGSDGIDGTAGLDGADGADGAPGPKGDKGDPGADGKDGVDGKDGRGIADLQCGPDGRWTVTYTDGTTGDAGVCRVGPGNPNEGARR